MTGWQLWQHRNKPEIKYWVRAADNVFGIAFTWINKSSHVEIRSPRNVMLEHIDKLWPPELSARSGYMPWDGFSNHYEPANG